MLQSVTIPDRNKSRKAASGRAWKHLPSPAGSQRGHQRPAAGPKAAPKGEEKGMRRRTVPFQKLRWTLMRKTLLLQPDPRSPCWKTLFSPSFPQRLCYVHHKLPPGMSNSPIHPFSMREGYSMVVSFSFVRFGVCRAYFSN